MNMDLLGLVPRSEMKTQAHAETQKYDERHVYTIHTNRFIRQKLISMYILSSNNNHTVVCIGALRNDGKYTLIKH